jgi:CRP-like cAMP-binding protein
MASRHLRKIELFRYASVDELFRISQISRQVRYEKGASVQRVGEPTEYIQVLMQGQLSVPSEGNGGGSENLSPPAILGFREALEGTTLTQEASASTEAIVLVMPVEEFRALLAANIELAQGLFRTLLGSKKENPVDREAGADGPSVLEMSVSRESSDSSVESRAGPVSVAFDGDELNPVDRALRLQSVPILSYATGEELYELGVISREKRVASGDNLFVEGQAASIILPLTGTVAISSPSGDNVRTVRPGQCLGVRETLAGSTWEFRGAAESPVRALIIERESLFDLLADRTNLLQSIFSSVFRNPSHKEARPE